MRGSRDSFLLILSKISSRIWRSIPLRRDQKERIKTFVFSNSSFLFTGSKAFRNWKSSRFEGAKEPFSTGPGFDETNPKRPKNQYDLPGPVGGPVDSIAVIIHVFYLDLLDELLDSLKSPDSIRVKYYITSPPGHADEIETRLKKLKFDYQYFALENRGRDILPFLQIMPVVIQDGFQVILKVHTKKSVQLKSGALWRKDLYEKLLGEKVFMEASNLFNSFPEIGMIGPAGHLVPMKLYYGSNSERLRSFCQAMKIPVPRLADMSFVAGSMFYARVQSLVPLLNLNLQPGDFESEAGQVDGTMAHTVERAFAVSTIASGYELVDFASDPKTGEKFITLDHKFSR